MKITTTKKPEILLEKFDNIYYNANSSCKRFEKLKPITSTSTHITK